ncbi:hypothetical protein EAG_11246 [Camponotus floridanus]|uniref:Uncharacterized protein n=1 Tax=Camponotus floridanus TaxID=104421 RepID=E2A0Q1_CAMFO|nr:hypothetical protein EAG_11246 [Camponotus floridanus]
MQTVALLQTRLFRNSMRLLPTIQFRLRACIKSCAAGDVGQFSQAAAASYSRGKDTPYIDVNRYHLIRYYRKRPNSSTAKPASCTELITMRWPAPVITNVTNVIIIITTIPAIRGPSIAVTSHPAIGLSIQPGAMHFGMQLRRVGRDWSLFIASSPSLVREHRRIATNAMFAAPNASLREPINESASYRTTAAVEVVEQSTIFAERNTERPAARVAIRCRLFGRYYANDTGAPEELDDLVPIRASPRWLTGNCERHFKDPLMHLTTAIAAALHNPLSDKDAVSRECRGANFLLAYHLTIKGTANSSHGNEKNV